MREEEGWVRLAGDSWILFSRLARLQSSSMIKTLNPPSRGPSLRGGRVGDVGMSSMSTAPPSMTSRAVRERAAE